jgi:hypothetical protein
LPAERYRRWPADGSPYRIGDDISDGCQMTASHIATILPMTLLGQLRYFDDIAEAPWWYCRLLFICSHATVADDIAAHAAVYLLLSECIIASLSAFIYEQGGAVGRAMRRANRRLNEESWQGELRRAGVVPGVWGEES